MNRIPAKVVLVDDHPLFRAGVAAVLRADPGFVVVAETDSPRIARELIAAHRPDIAIVDILLGSEDGIQLVAALRREFPQLRLVVLSMLDESVYAARALQAGADAFLSKRDGPASIVRALKAPRDVNLSRSVPTTAADRVATLSERELQVFRELGCGRSTQEIAETLGVSVKTIETHRESIKEKLGLPHANALVARAALWAREQGFTR